MAQEENFLEFVESRIKQLRGELACLEQTRDTYLAAHVPGALAAMTTEPSWSPANSLARPGPRQAKPRGKRKGTPRSGTLPGGLKLADEIVDVLRSMGKPMKQLEIADVLVARHGSALKRGSISGRVSQLKMNGLLHHDAANSTYSLRR